MKKRFLAVVFIFMLVFGNYMVFGLLDLDFGEFLRENNFFSGKFTLLSPNKKGDVDVGDGERCSPMDKDCDGVFDSDDNCPDMENPGQEDWDDDGIGDACDLDNSGCSQSDSDGDGVFDNRDRCFNEATIAVNRNDGCPLPIARNFTHDLTINFSELPSLLDISYVSIGINNTGKIEYINENVDLVSIDEESGYAYPLNLDEAVIIGYDLIDIDPEYSPELNNDATLHFYNLDLLDPVIYIDDEVCYECEILLYEDWNLSFTVEGFSSYYADENYCGDGICGADEVCDTDCGGYDGGYEDGDYDEEYGYEIQTIDLDIRDSYVVYLVFNEKLRIIFNGEEYFTRITSVKPSRITLRFSPLVYIATIETEDNRLVNLDSFDRVDVRVTVNDVSYDHVAELLFERIGVEEMEEIEEREGIGETFKRFTEDLFKFQEPAIEEAIPSFEMQEAKLSNLHRIFIILVIVLASFSIMHLIHRKKK